MTRPAWVIGSALALSSGAVAAADIVYPADNNRSGVRDDPAMFWVEWPQATPLNGKAAPKGRLVSDLQLHRSSWYGPAPAPWLDLLYPVESEREFNGEWMVCFSRRIWWLGYIVPPVYLICLWAGLAHMRDRPAYNLKGPLAIWNLILAVFSFIGMIRTAPHLLFLLYSMGFNYTVCRSAAQLYGNGAVVFWVSLFIYSKYIELIDTWFLVVRKKPVAFLHWYHHCSVLLYCWHAFLWEMPTGIYFTSMNYSVHAIMYFYYFLAAVCKRPPRWALMVTILQLTQMAIGIIVTVSHTLILVNRTVDNCDGYMPNLIAALLMYASYFLLFAEFLCKRYCCGGRKEKGATNGATNGANKTKKVE